MGFLFIPKCTKIFHDFLDFFDKIGVFNYPFDYLAIFLYGGKRTDIFAPKHKVWLFICHTLLNHLYWILHIVLLFCMPKKSSSFRNGAV